MYYNTFLTFAHPYLHKSSSVPGNTHVLDLVVIVAATHSTLRVYLKIIQLL